MQNGISDRVGSLFIAACTLILAGVLLFQSFFRMSEEAALYPKLLAVVLLVTVGLLLVRTIRQTAGSGKRMFVDVQWKDFFVVLGTWLIAIALLDILGVYLAIAIFLTITCTYLAKGTGSFIKIAAFAVIFTIILWAVFTLFLGIMMPSGILF